MTALLEVAEMKTIVFAITFASAVMLGSTTTSAGPLNCDYEPVYAPGPPEYDHDGDGVWTEPGKAITQYGAILGFTVTCEGVENEEVEP
ncbi:hypothetical protein N0B44_30520 [Roseibacterium beibuensis]|uniref:hypothetical protein n=1 Tax=[Roseibacterium] beibuensis TaxID=1193142 RepID=UPI00217ED6FD|nr:hypothetical protein [Roseibacterium beibuensis]MCS6627249.1 hypothetical protein [Roseibacterium beibuensis]